jgi:hypothetical protein
LKIIIVLILLVIIASLGSALYHLATDKEKTAKTARALTWRIGLSMGLFLLLIAAFASGLIQPHSFSGGMKTAAEKAIKTP